MTRDVVPKLMFSHAPFLCKICTGGTFLFIVTGVKNWMITLMLSGAGFLTLRRSRATGYWRKNHRLPTVTSEFIKTCLPTILTVPTMARLITSVKAAVEFMTTN